MGNGRGRAGMTGTDRRGQAWGGEMFGLVDGLRVSWLRGVRSAIVDCNCGLESSGRCCCVHTLPCFFGRLLRVADLGSFAAPETDSESASSFVLRSQ